MDFLHPLMLIVLFVILYFHYYIEYHMRHRPIAEKMNNFRAVSQFQGIETYYHRLRFRGFGQPSQGLGTEREAVRKAVCKSILNSYYFEMLGEEYLDVDAEEIRNELRSNYPDTFYSVYRVSNDRPSPLAHDDGYEYRNDYEVQTVRVLDRIEEEYVITCLARSTASRAVKKYFVSQPYNVNLVRGSRTNTRILGRFIFSHHSNNDPVMVAMAEESAYQHDLLRKLKIFHLLYTIWPLSEREIARVPFEDPICSLSAANKLRLCTSLFAATIFKQKGFKYTPIMESVNVNCVKRRTVGYEPILLKGIPLLERLGRVISNWLHQVGQWMIGCKATNSRGDRVVFYVSSGGGEHEILVHTKSNVPGQVNLYGTFYNVSVVEQWRPYSGQPVETLIYEDVED